MIFTVVDFQGWIGPSPYLPSLPHLLLMLAAILRRVKFNFTGKKLKMAVRGLQGTCFCE